MYPGGCIMRVFLLILFCGLVFSCMPFGFNPMGYEKLETPLDEAWLKVSAQKYIADPEHYWKSPKEFFADGGGDCEDFASALVYLLGTNASSIRISMVFSKTTHRIVKYDGMFLEPGKYGIYYDANNLVILAEYDYNEDMMIATDYGRKGLIQ
jgi:hypothetical protein